MNAIATASSTTATTAATVAITATTAATVAITAATFATCTAASVHLLSISAACGERGRASRGAEFNERRSVRESMPYHIGLPQLCALPICTSWLLAEEPGGDLGGRNQHKPTRAEHASMPNVL